MDIKTKAAFVEHQHNLEYQDCKNYEMRWVCRCGFEETKYIECNG